MKHIAVQGPLYIRTDFYLKLWIINVIGMMIHQIHHVTSKQIHYMTRNLWSFPKIYLGSFPNNYFLVTRDIFPLATMILTEMVK